MFYPIIYNLVDFAVGLDCFYHRFFFFLLNDSYLSDEIIQTGLEIILLGVVLFDFTDVISF